jgi:hypothetical protein
VDDRADAAARECGIHRCTVTDVGTHEFKLPAGHELTQALEDGHFRVREIVDNKESVTLARELHASMCADVTEPAGDENVHAEPP